MAMVTPVGAPAGSGDATNVISATRLLAERGPQLARLERDIDEYQHRLQDTEQLLTMPRKERLAHCGRPLFDACRDQVLANHAELSAVVALGAMGIGATATVMAARVSPQLGLLVGIGALAAGLAGVPPLYMAGVKRWLVPKSMDPLVVDGLKRERVQLSSALVEAREREAALQKEIEATATARDASGPAVTVEPAFVVINGMKVPVRR